VRVASSSRPSNAQQPVAVPVQWTTPVAASNNSGYNDLPPPASTMPVAPQTPIATVPPAGAEPESAQSPPSIPPTRPAIVVTDLAPLQAAPSSPPPLPAGAPAPSTALQGFWVQLGAFRERDGAESMLNQAAHGVPALAPQLRVFSEAGTHRLQAGPFPSRSAASEVVTQLRDSLRIAPMVVERR
jgi:rare lipoprotein A